MRFFTDWVKSIDKFSDPVQVKYKGAGGFKTHCGGVLSLISKIVVTFFMITNFNRMFSRANPNVTTTVKYHNYEHDDKVYNIGSSELDALVKLEILDRPDGTKGTRSWESLDEKYGRIVAFQISYKWPEKVHSPIGTHDEDIESITDFFMDVATDLSGFKIETKDILPLEDCAGDHHLKNLDDDLRHAIIDTRVFKCLDLTHAKLSGGTLHESEENIVGIEWQHCEKFKPASECATAEEKEDFFHDIKVKLEMVENYIDFDQPETQDAIHSRRMQTLIVNSASEEQKHIKGVVELGANVVTFQDAWESVYDPFSIKKFTYLSVDRFYQFHANDPEHMHLPYSHPLKKELEIQPQFKGDLPDFGFTFLFKRSSKETFQKRHVYTILMYLASIGGTVKIFETVFKPLLSWIQPAPLFRDVLNNNFKYDEVAQGSSLAENMQDSAFTLKSPDLQTIMDAPESLARYLITWWNTIMLAHFSCCAKRNRQLKRLKKGKQTLNKHLDIVKMVKRSNDVSILKKLLMGPRQRAIMKKQRRYAFKLDSDHPDSSSGDEGGDTFKYTLATYPEHQLKATMDRQLMLGVLARNIDMEPPVRATPIVPRLEDVNDYVTAQQDSMEMTGRSRVGQSASGMNLAPMSQVQNSRESLPQYSVRSDNPKVADIV